MSKYPLLSIVQQVLSSIDGDEVNSIGDTIEASQVANLIHRTYDNIDAKATLPSEKRLFEFDATSDKTPTMLRTPENIDGVDWFKYNCRTTTDTDDQIRDIKYLMPKDFYELILGFKQTSPNVGKYVHRVDGFNTPFFYENDHGPRYWTSFDDEVVVTDAYDSALDACLQSVKSTGYGRLINVWKNEDSFVVDIADDQYPLLINESIALAWAEMKQSMNAKVEKQARVQWITTQKSKREIPGIPSPLSRTPNYGRH